MEKTSWALKLTTIQVATIAALGSATAGDDLPVDRYGSAEKAMAAVQKCFSSHRASPKDLGDCLKAPVEWIYYYGEKDFGFPARMIASIEKAANLPVDWIDNLEGAERAARFCDTKQQPLQKIYCRQAQIQWWYAFGKKTSADPAQRIEGMVTEIRAFAPQAWDRAHAFPSDTPDEITRKYEALEELVEWYWDNAPDYLELPDDVENQRLIARLIEEQLKLYPTDSELTSNLIFVSMNIAVDDADSGRTPGLSVAPITLFKKYEATNRNSFGFYYSVTSLFSARLWSGKFADLETKKAYSDTYASISDRAHQLWPERLELLEKKIRAFEPASLSVFSPSIQEAMEPLREAKDPAYVDRALEALIQTQHLIDIDRVHSRYYQDLTVVGLSAESRAARIKNPRPKVVALMPGITPEQRAAAAADDRKPVAIGSFEELKQWNSRTVDELVRR